MNDEVKAIGLYFIVHPSSFIVSLCRVSPNFSGARGPTRRKRARFARSSP
jgi:hypothetical protein